MMVFIFHSHSLTCCLRCYTDSVNQVVSLAKDGHFQLACARHFELLHPGTTLLKLNHPNQYPLFVPFEFLWVYLLT